MKNDRQGEKIITTLMSCIPYYPKTTEEEKIFGTTLVACIPP